MYIIFRVQTSLCYRSYIRIILRIRIISCQSHLELLSLVSLTLPAMSTTMSKVCTITENSVTMWIISFSTGTHNYPKSNRMIGILEICVSSSRKLFKIWWMILILRIVFPFSRTFGHKQNYLYHCGWRAPTSNTLWWGRTSWLGLLVHFWSRCLRRPRLLRIVGCLNNE